MTTQVFLGGGENPIPDDVWVSYEPPPPWAKNSTRNLFFDETCIFKSPNTPTDCVGDDCFLFTEVSGYTWMYLAKSECLGCIPDTACTLDGPLPSPGHVSITVIRKCQESSFVGTIYQLIDPWGNRYVQHASAYEEEAEQQAARERVVLPDGWTLAPRELDERLTLIPRGEECYFTIIRDNEDNSTTSTRSTAFSSQRISCHPAQGTE